MQNKWACEPWANRFRVGFKQYKDTNIAYQGTYELIFLEKLESINGIEWIKHNLKRGAPIWYIDSKQKRRVYLPDFLNGKTLYEIKSKFTWNRDIENNKRKLDEAVKQGYNVILIINQNEYDYTSAINRNMV